MPIKTLVRGAALGLVLASTAALAGTPETPNRMDLLADEATLTAKVIALDVPNRLAILQLPDGEHTQVITIPQQIRNLPQVEPGDTITVSYVESLAISVEAAPGMSTEVQVRETDARAAPGLLPAGATVNQVTMTARLLAFDSNSHLAILEGPGGHERQIAVEGQELQSLFAGFQPGDVVQVVFTEAVALEIQRA